MRASDNLDIEMLAQSAEHTTAGVVLQSTPDPITPNRAEDLAVARPVVQSVADLRVTPDPVASLDDAIDQITAELAAFCFERLEGGNALDLNTDASVLEDEHRVRY